MLPGHLSASICQGAGRTQREQLSMEKGGKLLLWVSILGAARPVASGERENVINNPEAAWLGAASGACVLGF